MPHSILINRIRSEYLEMPGLRLTVPQAQRLCGVDRATCQIVLQALVDAQFLCIKPDGTYARLTDGDAPRIRAARATLSTRPPRALAS